jgi:hypothetical protein
MKICIKCKLEKIINDFSIGKNQCKVCRANYHKTWCIKNATTYSEYHREYQSNRCKIDVNYRLTRRLRKRLNDVINGKQKIGSAVKDLGCSITELKVHLESKFTEGMTWDNYGDWHIDHIRPLSSFDLLNHDQLKEACNYINLQPLWAEDNLAKGDTNG